MSSQQSGSSGTAFEQALRGAGIETVDDIAALSEQRRAQRAEQRARADQQPGAAPKPAAPPRPPTMRERLRGGEIVPIDELLAMQKDLLAEVAAEGARFQAESKEATARFNDLCKLTAELGGALQTEGLSRRGSALTGLRQQFDLRVNELAHLVRENTGSIEVAARIGAMANVGRHFGQLSQALSQAAIAQFCERIDDKQYRLEVAAGRKHLVLSGRSKERYLPRGYQESLLVQLVVGKLRELQAKAIATADQERAEQFAILRSGQFPEAMELIGLLDPSKPIAGERTFGCLLVQAPLPDTGDRISHLNGFVQIRILTHPETDTKCIAVEKVVGGAQRVLQPITALLTPEGLQEAPAVAALVGYLRYIAIQAMISDEKAAQVNAKFTELGQTSSCVPEKEERRWLWFTELRGDEWRKRNTEWIKRQRRQRRPDAAQQVLAEAAEAAGSVPAATETGTAPAEQPTRRRGGKDRGKGKGGNGVHEGAATTPAADAAAPEPKTDETPAS